MKKFKLFLTILLGISVVFVSCKDPEVEHKHNFSEKWEIDEYYHWKKCSCGEIDFEAEHTIGDWKVTQEPTEETEGKQEGKCTVCPYKATEVIEKLAHTHKFATDWTKDETNHWHAATCGHEVTDGKVAHTFGNWTTTKAATEEAEGSRERSCTVCGYTATEAIEKLAHTHKFATNWTKDETHHWHAATCGHTTEVSEKAEHTFGNWTTTKEATEEAEGSKEHVCTVCNYKEVVDIAKIPENFVLIPAGTFQMGSEAGCYDNVPVVQVTITKDFYMGKYEVTQAEYEKYCSYGEDNPSSSYGDGDNYPAYYVSWYDALLYCNKRSIAEDLTPCYSISGNTDPGKWGTVPTSTDSTWNAVVCDWNANGYRLPTEAEWEYAARAGDNTVDSLTYSGTSDVNKLGEYAWYVDNSDATTHPVGTKKSNAFGLYDMTGNVGEWCWNWYTNRYDTGKEGGSDPTGTSAGASRVCRGGSWYIYSEICAVSYRCSVSPYYRYSYDLGFRVVRSAFSE